MDYDKLIERLRKHRVIYKTNYDEFSGGACTADCVDAADIISTLHAENEQLRSDLRRLQTERDALLAANRRLLAEREQLTAERDAAVEEVKHLKAVMRDEGIVVIPPKYPWEKSKWNV